MFAQKFLKKKYLITDKPTKISSQDNFINRLRKKLFFILFKKLPYHPPLPYSSKINSLLGFSLMEALIIIALISAIAVAVLILFNPKKQIDKSWDGKRKTELGQLKKILEDWYNDKNCYPRPDQICFDSVNTDFNTCHICGRVLTPTDFTAYLKVLPCDPQHPTKKYLYQVDNVICPTWYRIYTTLSNSQDPTIKEVGCGEGCGIGDYTGFIFNYGVSSPNIGLEAGPGNYYCQGVNNCTVYDTNRKTCTPSFSSPNCDSPNWQDRCQTPSVCVDKVDLY